MSKEEALHAKSLAKTYTKLMWKRDRLKNKDLNRKIKLKWAAIYALPNDEAKKAALIIDPYVPLDYRYATETPPLMGFPGGGIAEEEEVVTPTASSTASSSTSGKTDTKSTKTDTSSKSATASSTPEKRASSMIKGTLRNRKRTQTESLEDYGITVVDPLMNKNTTNTDENIPKSSGKKDGKSKK